MRIRAATIEDAEAAGALLLELPGGLRDLVPDADTASRVARAVFVARRSALSHSFAFVVEDRGRVVGLMVRLPGRTWRKLRLSTGFAMIRAAGAAETPRLLRRGRIQDRLIPPVSPSSLYLPALVVVPERRSQGIGMVLLLRAVGEASGLGLRSVSLDVEATNHGAIRLYERTGFLRLSEHHIEATRRMPAVGSVRMELPLDARR